MKTLKYVGAIICGLIATVGFLGLVEMALARMLGLTESAPPVGPMLRLLVWVLFFATACIALIVSAKDSKPPREKDKPQEK